MSTLLWIGLVVVAVYAASAAVGALVGLSLRRWTVKCGDGWVVPRRMRRREARRLARLADRIPGPYCEGAPHEIVRAR